MDWNNDTLIKWLTAHGDFEVGEDDERQVIIFTNLYNHNGKLFYYDESLELAYPFVEVS